MPKTYSTKTTPIWVTAGIWIWGGVTAILGCLVVTAIIFSWPAGLHEQLQKDAAAALGAVIAASGLAWSYFFSTASKQDESNTLEEVRKALADIQTKLDRLLPPK